MEQQLTASSADASERFGTSVFTDGSRVAVGAGFVFEFVGWSWVETRRAHSVASASAGRAGSDVALEGDRLALADEADNTLGFGEGAVFLFQLGGVDLNANGIPDGCELATTPSCGPGVANSTGGPGSITVLASPAPEDHLVDLLATGLPNFQFGYFLASQTAPSVLGPGGSQGTLCLGGTIGRFTGQVGNTAASGGFRIQVDTRALPNPLPSTFAAGQSWIFQVWFRDANPTATSNFTDAVVLQFL